jgi:hypothetical protein
MFWNLRLISNVHCGNQDQPWFSFTINTLNRIEHFHGTLIINFFRSFWTALSTRTSREYDDILTLKCGDEIRDRGEFE